MQDEFMYSMVVLKRNKGAIMDEKKRQEDLQILKIWSSTVCHLGTGPYTSTILLQYRYVVWYGTVQHT